LPNWEYYTLICIANDDRVLLAATFEMARANPMLILRYSVRNLIHFIFNPGFKHSRYNLNPFSPEGLWFYPAYGDVAGNTLVLPRAAVRELILDPAWHEPWILHRIFSRVQTAWLENYKRAVFVMACLMSVAWLAVAANLVRAFRRRAVVSAASESTRSFGFTNTLIASIVIASLVFGYNAAVTSIFAEPDFRYREAADLQAIVIAGLGVIALQQWAAFAFAGNSLTGRIVERWNEAVHLTAVLDIWRRWTGEKLAIAVICVATAGFSAWTIFMLVNTRP
jgi:hypothetical protein